MKNQAKLEEDFDKLLGSMAKAFVLAKQVTKEAIMDAAAQAQKVKAEYDASAAEQDDTTHVADDLADESQEKMAWKKWEKDEIYINAHPNILKALSYIETHLKVNSPPKTITLSFSEKELRTIVIT